MLANQLLYRPDIRTSDSAYRFSSYTTQCGMAHGMPLYLVGQAQKRENLKNLFTGSPPWLGSAGNSPVPPGHWPCETGEASPSEVRSPFEMGASTVVPFGGSPNGTGW